MKIIGLTGGIGSGKTTVSKIFEKLNIPVYISDTEAKKLTNNSKFIKNKLIDLLGDNAFSNNTLNKDFVAKLIFNDTQLLKKVNSIIHPRVAAHFVDWCSKQVSPYIIKESAIIFENDTYKNFDYTVLITAPKELRIRRVLERETISRKAILDRMNNQLTDEEKIKKADFVIHNIDLLKTEEKVKEIHNFLINN